jgi:hypothetical protein
LPVSFYKQKLGNRFAGNSRGWGLVNVPATIAGDSFSQLVAEKATGLRKQMATAPLRDTTVSTSTEEKILRLTTQDFHQSSKPLTKVKQNH